MMRHWCCCKATALCCRYGGFLSSATLYVIVTALLNMLDIASASWSCCSNARTFEYSVCSPSNNSDVQMAGATADSVLLCCDNLPLDLRQVLGGFACDYVRCPSCRSSCSHAEQLLSCPTVYLHVVNVSQGTNCAGACDAAAYNPRCQLQSTATNMHQYNGAADWSNGRRSHGTMLGAQSIPISQLKLLGLTAGCCYKVYAW